MPLRIRTVEDARKGSPHLERRLGFVCEPEAIAELDCTVDLSEVEDGEVRGWNGQRERIQAGDAQADDRQLRQQAPRLKQGIARHRAQRQLCSAHAHDQVRGDILASARRNRARELEIAIRGLPSATGLEARGHGPTLTRLLHAKVQRHAGQHAAVERNAQQTTT